MYKNTIARIVLVLNGGFNELVSSEFYFMQANGAS